MKNIGILAGLLFAVIGVTACNSGGGGGGGGAGSYQFSTYQLSHSCTQIGSTVYESVTYSIAAIAPEAYFQLAAATIPTGVTTLSAVGNCSPNQISVAPTCNYSFVYESSTPTSVIQVQLNGSLGIQNVATFSVGGSCI